MGRTVERVIVDSAMTLEEAFAGKVIPREILETQRLLDVDYLSDDGKLHAGQIIVHEEMVERISLIFLKLLETRFPLHRVEPASAHGWNDALLMKRNITTSFNPRPIKNRKRISPHGFGLAADFNPLLNPCFYPNGEVDPPGAWYDPKRPGTLTADGEEVRFIRSLGLTWGGDWNPAEGPVDTQHIEDREQWLRLVGRGE